MRPPICALCDQDALDGGDIIDFKKGPSDLEWDRKAERGDWIGHPPYADWFCKDHIAAAREVAHLSLPEAMRILKGGGMR